MDIIVNILREIVAFVEKRWILRALVGPILVVLPPTVLGASDYSLSLHNWFDNHEKVKTICSFWPVLLIPASLAYDKYRVRISLSLEQLGYLIEVLERLAAKKVERFAEQLRKLDSKFRRVDAGNTFKSITQPDAQIREIVTGIWQYFESMRSRIDSDVEIRVALARMGEKHIVEFFCHYPPNKAVRSPISHLQIDQSGFSRAKSAKKILIVEDTRLEGTKGNSAHFVVTRDDLKEEEGSMICYPIEEPSRHNIPFVLSVCANRKEYFKSSETEIYQSILEQFALRLSLEYCLMELKRRSR